MENQERQRFVPNLILALILYLLQKDKETGNCPILSLKCANKQTFGFCEEFSSYLDTCLVPKYNPNRKNTPVEDETEQRLIKEIEAHKLLMQAEEFTSNEAKKKELDRLDKQMQNISAHKRFRQPFLINKFNDEYIKISIPDTNDYVLNGLKQYIETQSKDGIYNPEGNIESWKHLKTSFKNSIDKTLNLSSYYITNTQYITVIAHGWINGSIKINNISFKINNSEILDPKNPLCFSNEDGELFFNKDFRSYHFSCNLDLSEFFGDKKTLKKDEKISEKELIKQKISKYVQDMGTKGNKEVQYKKLISLIEEVRQDKELKNKHKVYENYISEVNKYMKNNSFAYILLRKEGNCYPIAPLITPKERGKIHIESKGKTVT